ncbi:hypothetical protein [Dysgonomonas sp. Marseille-P4361]|uniref:hypothetical protein n=1 Tax=Dysgonomonas sp. Marseille-P4361 TaxID=2161820 RepID=UPI000D559CDC|nr:hypothetical protein [Dysgonomonas sp. Marseille-P4361]
MAKVADKQAFNEWEAYREALKRSTVVDITETYAQKQARIKMLEADDEAWFAYYLPMYNQYEPAPFHKRSTKRIQGKPGNEVKGEARERCLRGEWFEVDAWARELAKSTQAMKNVLKLTLTGKKKNVIMVSNSEDNAKRLLEPYRANLDSNQRIINDYGLQKSFKWKDTEFKTRKGISFRAVGADQSPRGTRNDAARPDVILIDDIDTDQDCRNPEIIKKRVDWIFGALIPTRAVNIPLLVLVCGNIIAEYCCVTELMKKADFVDIVNIRTNGKSSWEAKNSEEDIDRVLSTISYAAAQTEYFNNPQTEGRVFKKLNWGKVPPLRELEQLIVYADPSPSSREVKNNSYKVVALMGRDKEGVTYVIKALCEQTTNAKFVNWFYDIYELTKGYNVYYYIENNSLQDPFYQDVFIPLFKEIGRSKGYIVPIRPDARKKPDKFTRIEGTLEPANRLGLLIFNEREKDNQHMQTVVEQFGVVSPTYKGAMDAPDCIEGGYKILDENLAKRQGTYRTQRRSSRRY